MASRPHASRHNAYAGSAPQRCGVLTMCWHVVVRTLGLSDLGGLLRGISVLLQPRDAPGRGCNSSRLLALGGALLAAAAGRLRRRALGLHSRARQ